MRNLLFLLFPIIIISACNNADNSSKVDNRPNIILIVSDDHGMDDAGCYGNDAIKTPNLDYLASEGLCFNNAFCTTSSCSASRSVILTGVYNHANGQFGHAHAFHHFRTFDNIRSMPLLLTEAGYTSARIGKYHVAPEEIYPFDHVLEGNCRSPFEMSENCREIINSDMGSPFFLYYCTCDPHRGGGTLEDQPYNPDRFGNEPGGWPKITPVTFSPEDVEVPYYLPDLPATRAELAQYYESVARLDQGIGHLLEIIKESGNWDNTIIIYISDNGIAFPGAKTNLYEPGMRLPCIVRDPSATGKGIATDAMICWADLAPTILDYAKVLPEDNSIPGKSEEEWVFWRIPNPSEFQGHSFKEVIYNPDIEGYDEIYASHTFHEINMYYPMRVVRTRNYKLIWNIAHGLNYPEASDLWESATWQAALAEGNGYYAERKIEDYSKRPQYELYNLVEDPHELINLAYDQEYTEVLEELKTKIKAFQERTIDPWVTKWEYD